MAILVELTKSGGLKNLCWMSAHSAGGLKPSQRHVCSSRVVRSPRFNFLNVHHGRPVGEYVEFRPHSSQRPFFLLFVPSTPDQPFPPAMIHRTTAHASHQHDPPPPRHDGPPRRRSHPFPPPRGAARAPHGRRRRVRRPLEGRSPPPSAHHRRPSVVSRPCPSPPATRVDALVEGADGGGGGGRRDPPALSRNSHPSVSPRSLPHVFGLSPLSLGSPHRVPRRSPRLTPSAGRARWWPFFNRAGGRAPLARAAGSSPVPLPPAPRPHHRYCHHHHQHRCRCRCAAVPPSLYRCRSLQLRLRPVAAAMARRPRPPSHHLRRGAPRKRTAGRAAPPPHRVVPLAVPRTVVGQRGRALPPLIAIKRLREPS